MISGDRLTMSVEEAAMALGVSRGTCYEAVRTGQIPTVRLGRRLLVPVEALRALLRTTVAGRNEKESD
jgi:excisionase family DNA binding protein